MHGSGQQTGFVGFHTDPAYLPQQMPGTHYITGAWLEQCEPGASKKRTTTRVASHYPVTAAGLTRAR